MPFVSRAYFRHVTIRGAVDGSMHGTKRLRTPGDKEAIDIKLILISSRNPLSLTSVADMYTPSILKFSTTRQLASILYL